MARRRASIMPVGTPILSRRAALAAALTELRARPAASQVPALANPWLASPGLAGLAQVAEDGDLMWYESSPRDQLDRVAASFAQSFPAVRTRVRGETIAGVAILGRV